MARSLDAIAAFGVRRGACRYFIPPYEWYNAEVARWSREMGLTLINYTPGTRSNADYTEDAASNFVSAKVIFDSIVNKEKKGGLNGYLLLMHLGVGPRRADKMAGRLGELLDYLQSRGYKFMRVDELLGGKPRGN
jgi:peptidoglycan/xylan/chitin deacetylase (PgdA/CDA1 family)